MVAMNSFGSHDDCTGMQPLIASGRFPAFPEPSKYERRIVRHPDRIRLFHVAGALLVGKKLTGSLTHRCSVDVSIRRPLTDDRVVDFSRD
jgi:hypothetical protein